MKYLRGSIEIVDTSIYREYHPEIEKMRIFLKKYFEQQKYENFKIIREIAIIDTENNDFQENIYDLLTRLNYLEIQVGLKSKAFTYIFDKSILENEIHNRILIEKEDI